MIIVDNALKERELNNNPIKIGMIGAGFMGQALAHQFYTSAIGMRLAAISNRHVDKAFKAYNDAGLDDVSEAKNKQEFDNAVKSDKAVVTSNPELLCRSKEIDVILEVTGTLEFGTKVVLDALQHKKHVVLMNAELDGTLGPILKVYADKNDVVITNVDGDQPGAIMNLYRHVVGIGLKPVLCGNIKGLEDHYRTPKTQEGFAKKWGQEPYMVTSFADGSKISYEQTLVANATGMKVGKRGMYGPTVPAGTPIEEVIDEYPEELLNTETGVVDYVIGASPGAGIYVIARNDNPRQQHFLDLFKMGEGPYYLFHTPYHLCQFEVPDTIGRAALFNDAAVAPSGGPSVEVIALAKKDLKAGEEIDGYGHYTVYGACENSEVVNDDNLLPLGIAGGCTLTKDIKKDQAITYDDVKVPEGRLIDKLREEQQNHFKKG